MVRRCSIWFGLPCFRWLIPLRLFLHWERLGWYSMRCDMGFLSRLPYSKICVLDFWP